MVVMVMVSAQVNNGGSDELFQGLCWVKVSENGGNGGGSGGRDEMKCKL